MSPRVAEEKMLKHRCFEGFQVKPGGEFLQSRIPVLVNNDCHIVLAAPLNVQFVTAFLTGSNREVDFQNMGFTAEVSAPRNVPDGGATAALFCLALGGVASARRFMVGS